MDVFVARQPIFDSRMRVVGYELLFREGLENAYAHSDGNQASAMVLSNTFFSENLEQITHGRRAFVNFTRTLLAERVALLFPPEHLVVEILEDVEPDKTMVGLVRELKKHGYRIALDDFAFRPEYRALVNLADMIKVDFLATPARERLRLPRTLGNKRMSFLAEKVETPEAFEEAIGAGYQLFQGYFFSKPVIVKGQDLPPYKLNYLHMLQLIHDPDAEVSQLEQVLKQDVALSYKLLRFVNSAAFGFKREIKSMRQAIVMLGFRELRKWLSFMILGKLSTDKPEELMMLSVQRAHFAEQIATVAYPDLPGETFFLAGLFSCIDAMIDRPMESILEHLPLHAEIKAALLGEANPIRQVLQLVMDYESGRWARLEGSRFAENESLWKALPEMYRQSVLQGGAIFQTHRRESMVQA